MFVSKDKTNSNHGKWKGDQPYANRCGYVCRKPYEGSPPTVLTSPSSHLTPSVTVIKHTDAPITETSGAISAISTTTAMPEDAVIVYRRNVQYLIRTDNDPSINTRKSRNICHQWGGELTNINSNQENKFIAGMT